MTASFKRTKSAINFPAQPKKLVLDLLHRWCGCDNSQHTKSAYVFLQFTLFKRLMGEPEQRQVQRRNRVIYSLNNFDLSTGLKTG